MLEVPPDRRSPLGLLKLVTVDQLDALMREYWPESSEKRLAEHNGCT